MNTFDKESYILGVKNQTFSAENVKVTKLPLSLMFIHYNFSHLSGDNTLWPPSSQPKNTVRFVPCEVWPASQY